MQIKDSGVGSAMAGEAGRAEDQRCVGQKRSKQYKSRQRSAGGEMVKMARQGGGIIADNLSGEIRVG